MLNNQKNPRRTGLSHVKKNNGQGLIEYLIIVAIMGVASIAVVKVLSSNLRSQFANVANALGSNQSQKIDSKTAGKTTYEEKDLSSFFQGAVSSQGK